MSAVSKFLLQRSLLVRFRVTSNKLPFDTESRLACHFKIESCLGDSGSVIFFKQNYCSYTKQYLPQLTVLIEAEKKKYVEELLTVQFDNDEDLKLTSISQDEKVLESFKY